MRDDLPGMWEDADLSGGWADSEAADRPSVTDDARAEAIAKERYPLREETNYHAGLYRGFLEGWAAGRAETTTAYEPCVTDADGRCILNHSAETTTATTEDAPRTLAAVKAALANHPAVCGRHDEDDPITCGWKAAVADVHAALAASRAVPSDHTATTEAVVQVLNAHPDMTDRSAIDGCGCGDPGGNEHVARELDRCGLLATARTRPSRDDLARALREGRTNGLCRPGVRCDLCDCAQKCEDDLALRDADAVLALLRGESR